MAWKVPGTAWDAKVVQVIPRRWVVERTLAWLSRPRRLARDHERLPQSGETMVHTAMSRNMLRCIAAWSAFPDNL